MSAPTLSPLAGEKTALVTQLVDGLHVAELQWLSGYMAGAASLLHADPSATAAPATEAAEAPRLSIVYGSQTGNAARLAEQLAQQAEAAGLHTRLLRADAYPVRELKRERLLYVIISTQGEGEPPDDARDLMSFLEGRHAPELPDLSYAVLALGDSSYPDFCTIGKRVDARLEALGATRLHARGEADVDLETVATPWLREALVKARETLTGPAAPLATVTPLHPRARAWSREKPFAAEVLLNQPIVATGNGHMVRHIELSLAGSGLSYEPGDALGVWPVQSPELVAAVLDTLKLDGDQHVEHAGETLPLTRWLRERRELTRLTRPFLAAHAERGQHDSLRTLLTPDFRQDLVHFFETRQLMDLLREHPADWDAEALVAALRPLAPRLYSIASSRAVVEDEVHLTVADIHYLHDDEQRWGVASRFLDTRAEGETVPVYIETNTRFRLPENGDRDIIMIGPGTGVAPFRAFVQQRQASNASGRNWLIFGNRHRRTDFLYQLEWQSALKSGALQHMDVAFSRDQDEKVYVQHRLRQRGRELHAWLENGAHLYVCGDATRMARDVHEALIDILAEHGNKSREAATTELDGWLACGRYARDVY